MAVIGEIEAGARAADGALEAIGLGDDVIGQDAAIRETTDAEAVGVGVTEFNRAIDGGQDVAVIFLAPTLIESNAKIPAIAGGAARIGAYDHVIVRGEELGFEGKTIAVLRDGAAVDEQERGVTKSGIEGRGLGDKSFDLKAVVALEMDFLGFAEFDPREMLLVDMGQLAKALFTGDEKLTGQVGFADPCDQRAIVGECEGPSALS